MDVKNYEIAAQVMGWDCARNEDGTISFATDTPLGGKFAFSAHEDNMVSDVMQFAANDFDVDAYAEQLLAQRQATKTNMSLSRIVKAAEEMQTSLLRLSEAFDRIQQRGLNLVADKSEQKQNKFNPKDFEGLTPVDAIKGMGWDVYDLGDGKIRLENWSPMGQDIAIETTEYSLVRDIRNTANRFDVKAFVEDRKSYLGQNHIPETLAALEKDAQNIGVMITDTAEKLEKVEELLKEEPIDVKIEQMHGSFCEGYVFIGDDFARFTKTDDGVEFAKFSEPGWMTGASYEAVIPGKIAYRVEEVEAAIEEAAENYNKAEHYIEGKVPSKKCNLER